jgi:hypothetical protein
VTTPPRPDHASRGRRIYLRPRHSDDEALMLVYRGFKTLPTASATIKGFEVMRMIRVKTLCGVLDLRFQLVAERANRGGSVPARHSMCALCGRGGIGRRAGLKIQFWLTECRFDSDRPHSQVKTP